MSTPRKIRCVVDRITNHGDQVYTIELKPERALPSFQPGQFLHLALDEYDPSACWPESRVFSIASSPAERERVRIVYSVKGVYTARMEKELVTGKVVWIKLPYGEFMVDGGRDAVLIAGGTGITAFQAFIEGLTPEHAGKVVLLYGARCPELLLARESVEAQRGRVGNLRAFYFSETGSAQGVLTGRVNLEVLCESAGDGAVYYLAGPPPMVAALRGTLEQWGIPADRIRVDAWE